MMCPSCDRPYSPLRPPGWAFKFRRSPYSREEWGGRQRVRSWPMCLSCWRRRGLGLRRLHNYRWLPRTG